MTGESTGSGQEERGRSAAATTAAHSSLLGTQEEANATKYRESEKAKPLKKGCREPEHR